MSEATSGGSRSTSTGANVFPLSGERTDYLLLLVALFGAVPIGPIELRGIEALYANSLAPKLEDGDREAGELKYYSWLKRARPTALPETRGLDAWKPTQDAWAFGFGVGVSFTGAGSVFQLKAFGAGFDTPDGAGLIIVVEFGMFGSKKPLALGVFEYDFRRGVFVLMIQLEITLDQIIDNFPEDLKLKIGGTITIGNKPGLIALGRLNDPEHLDRRQARGGTQRALRAEGPRQRSAWSGSRTATSAVASS